MSLPVNLGLVLEQSQRNAVNRSVAPSFVEEASRAIQMLKVLPVLFASPEAQVSDFEVGPEMTRRIPIRLPLVIRPMRSILQPVPCTRLMHIVWVILQELQRLGPQCLHTLGTIVNVDVKAVGFVVIGHPAENVVVDVAKEAHIGLYAPVVLGIE